MATDTRQTVEAHVAALNHGDLQAVLATFTPDATFTADGGTATGHAQLAGLFDAVVGDHRPRMILRSASGEGPTLDCRLTRRFTVTDERGEVAAAHDIEVRVVFTVSDGAISRVEVDPLT